jgi:tetratricopeptide (TPR) repeat protein
MKSIILLALFFGASLQLGAQKNKFDQTAYSAHLVKVYKEGLRYGDLGVAKQAIYEIIALDPTANASWRDSLAYIYLNGGGFAQAATLSLEQLKTKPNDKGMLAVAANALLSLGDYKQAIEYYEKSYAISKDINDLYQVANLQYVLARVSECEQTIAQVLALPEVEKAVVGVNFDRQVQNVPMKAAALNIQGAVRQQMNQPEEAKSLYEQALAIFPEFVLAKVNLEDLEKAKNAAPTGGGKK